MNEPIVWCSSCSFWLKVSAAVVCVRNCIVLVLVCIVGLEMLLMFHLYRVVSFNMYCRTCML